jgi:Cysteine-rich secretory protein family
MGFHDPGIPAAGAVPSDGAATDGPARTPRRAVGLTQEMLDERPPDDGHRLNILSSSFTHIGIAVYRAPSGTVWLTQDFSN